MRRREFIAGLGGAAVWPLVARAQQGGRVRRVGVLSYGSYSRSLLSNLRDYLKQVGWTEGRNLGLEFRFGNGDATQTRIFAADLVQLAPDVIVAVFFVAVRALQQETKTVPVVVMGGGDVVENGIVINSARPEGNVTGFTNAFGSLGGKWLELLKEVAPNITRVLHFGNPRSIETRSIETGARSLGVQVVSTPVSDVASTEADHLHI